MKEKLKLELDEINNFNIKNLNIAHENSSVLNNEIINKKTYSELRKSLVRKSNYFGLVNDSEIEKYISELCVSFKDLYLELLQR
jgi:hypothetical protein